MLLIYILYAFGFGYALRDAAETTAPLSPAAAWPIRVAIAALFPLVVLAVAVGVAKAYIETRAKQSPRGDGAEETV